MPYEPDTSGKNFANLVLFVYFQDQTDGATFFSNGTNAAKLANFYNGTASLSLTKYMDAVSAGAVKLCNILPQYSGSAITAIKLPYASTSETATNATYDYQIIAAALSELEKTVTIPGPSLDLNSDGIVDNLTVIIKGGDKLTPRRGSNDGASSIGGKKIGNYNFLYTYELMEQGNGFLGNGVGLIAHEFLHSWGYPDLYRSGANDYPVSGWDVMGGVTAMPSWPLAYLRMHFTKWVALETVTETRSLTFHAPGESDKGGSEAYILKSPLNENELFVIEMRRKNGSTGSTDVLDKDISVYMGTGEAGLIVYRVDTTVPGLSNFQGGTGVYVFRPRAGATLQDVQNAYLNEKSGRTTMGSDDASKTLADGALTFSNGVNSRIVISGVTTNADGTMTCTVTFPSLDEGALWDNTQLPENAHGHSAVASAAHGGTQYAVAYNGASKQFTLYRLDADGWKTVGRPKTASTGSNHICLVSHGGSLYLAYMDDSGGSSSKLAVCAVDPASGAWSDISVPDGSCTDFTMKSQGDGLYVVRIADSETPSLLKLEGNAFTEQKTFPTGLCGQPRTAFAGGKLYTSVRRANTGNPIAIYDAAGMNISDGDIASSVYDMAELDGKLTVVTSKDGNTVVHTYEGGVWTHRAPVSMATDQISVLSAGGSLFMAASTEDGVYVYQYDPAGNAWKQVGERVDAKAKSDTLTLSSDGTYLYVSLQDNAANSTIVRRHTMPASTGGGTEPGGGGGTEPGGGGGGTGGETGGGGGTEPGDPEASASPSPSPSASPSPSPSPSASASATAKPAAVAPDTGDETPLALYGALLLLCAAGLGLALTGRKKEDN